MMNSKELNTNSTSDTVIRDYTLDDLKLIADKQKELIDFHCSIDPEYYKPAQSAQVEFINYLSKKKNSNDFKLLLAENGKIVVGYVMGWIMERPPIYECSKIGYLSNIFVDYNHRGRGIGTKLFLELECWFSSKNVKYIEIKADYSNKKTIESFIAYGFEIRNLGFIKKI